MPTKTKGHWPKGKRRNVDRGDWQRLRARLAKYLDDHFARGRITSESLARDLGVSGRSVRRWLSGEDRPHADYQIAMADWLRKMSGWK